MKNDPVANNIFNMTHIAKQITGTAQQWTKIYEAKQKLELGQKKIIHGFLNI